MPANYSYEAEQKLLTTCGSNTITNESEAYSIEEYAGAANDYWAGYMEFDDQGWRYKNQDRDQMEVLETRLKKELEQRDNTDIFIVTFIHGWHHGADTKDCNVQEFRILLDRLNKRYSALPDKRTKVAVGIYVGWRGESISAWPLSELTLIDRSNVATRVAQGDIRQLFARLKQLQLTAKKSEKRNSLRTVVLGHSLGGLIAFTSLSPGLLNDLAIARPLVDKECKPLVDVDPKTSPSVFPEMLVLINPAFEATRFESIHDLVRSRDGCPYEAAMPRLIVLKSDSDYWTGEVFTALRRVTTITEKYPEELTGGKFDNSRRSNQIEANTHTVSAIPRYRAFRLCLTGGPVMSQRAVAIFNPMTIEAKGLSDKKSPVWVMGVSSRIIEGHNGFLFARNAGDSPEPYLLNWLTETIVMEKGNALDPELAAKDLDDQNCLKWPREGIIGRKSYVEND